MDLYYFNYRYSIIISHLASFPHFDDEEIAPPLQLSKKRNRPSNVS